MSEHNNLLTFYDYLHRLKKLHRRGWLLRGVDETICESVAGHMYSMSWLALYFLKDFPELDETKVLKMCLIHDIGESIIGDITPVDDVTPEEKYKREVEAINEIFSQSNFIELWKEFEAKETPESIFVNDLDKLDLLLQALKYKNELGKSTSEFTQSALSLIKNERILIIAVDLVERCI